MHNARRWVIGLGLGSAALFAIVGALVVGSREEESTPPASAAERYESGDYPSMDLSAAVSAGDPSDGEREAMRDGLLTWDEYQVLVAETVACLEAEGFTILHFTDSVEGLFGSVTALGSARPGVATSDEGRISYVASGGATDDVGKNAETVSRCKANSAVVELLWAQHTAPSSEAVQRGMDEIGACLRASGFDVPVHPTKDDLEAVALRAVSETPPGTPRLRPEYAACELPVARTTRLR